MPDPIGFAVFGAATKAFDILLDLLKGGIASRRRFLEDHINPIYKQLEVIHKDYMKTISILEIKLIEPGDAHNKEELVEGFIPWKQVGPK